MGNLLSTLSPLTPFIVGAIWKILVPLVLFSLIKNLFIYPFFLSPLKDLPGPSAGIPLFGQSLKLFLTNNGPNQTLLDWSRKWPKSDFIRYLSIGNSEVLLINSLQAHKEIMSTHVYSLVKPAFFRRLVGEITGVGLLFADGEEHKKQRRLLANPFSARNIQRLVPVFKEKGQDLVQIFKSKIDSTGEKSAVLERTYSPANLGRTAGEMGKLTGLSIRHILQSHPRHNRPHRPGHRARQPLRRSRQHLSRHLQFPRRLPHNLQSITFGCRDHPR